MAGLRTKADESTGSLETEEMGLEGWPSRGTEAQQGSETCKARSQAPMDMKPTEGAR